MSKAKRIAISAMCCAVASVCMFLLGLPGLKWIVLVLGVVSSVAVVIPLMLDAKNLVYTLLTYIVSSILGVFLGLANIVYVLPIVVFCMPVAIVKVCGEMVKITASHRQRHAGDGRPFRQRRRQKGGKPQRGA